MMHQPGLFDRLPEPRAHAADPLTSHEAAHRARDLAKRHAAVVLATLRHGPSSAEGIVDRLGGALNTLQVMKRLSELLQAGEVEVVDEAGRTSSGRRCRRYRVAARTNQ